MTSVNIKFYTDIAKYRDSIIDAFTEEYGEKYRDTITKRYDELEFYHYLIPGGLEDVYRQEVKQLERLKKKINGHESEVKNRELVQKYNQLLDELISLEKYLYYHDLVKEHVFFKHINAFIDRNQKYLTEEDQKKWQETHNFFDLEHGEILLTILDVNYRDLSYYNNHLYEDRISNFLPNGLLESFLFGKVKENQCENSALSMIYEQQRKYEEIMGRTFEEMNITDDDVLKLNQDRLQMIDDLLWDYYSHFLGYSMNLIEYQNKKYIFDMPLSLDVDGLVAFFYPCVRKKGNKFIYSPYIVFPPTTICYLQNDHTYIHEIAHGINTNVEHLSNRFVVNCGLEKFEYYKKKEKEKETTSRKYECLNEFLNDYLASRVTKHLHQKGIYIWQKEHSSRAKKNNYQKFYCYIEPFYLKYKDAFIDYFMTGNRASLESILPSDLEKMAQLANYIYYDYYKKINKIENEKDLVKKHRGLTKANQKIKRISHDYHHNIGL